jgi:hypothetical protein
MFSSRIFFLHFRSRCRTFMAPDDLWFYGVFCSVLFFRMFSTIGYRLFGFIYRDVLEKERVGSFLLPNCFCCLNNEKDGRSFSFSFIFLFFFSFIIYQQFSFYSFFPLMRLVFFHWSFIIIIIIIRLSQPILAIGD